MTSPDGAVAADLRRSSGRPLGGREEGAGMRGVRSVVLSLVVLALCQSPRRAYSGEGGSTMSGRTRTGAKMLFHLSFDGPEPSVPRWPRATPSLPSRSGWESWTGWTGRASSWKARRPWAMPSRGTCARTAGHRTVDQAGARPGWSTRLPLPVQGGCAVGSGGGQHHLALPDGAGDRAI